MKWFVWEDLTDWSPLSDHIGNVQRRRQTWFLIFFCLQETFLQESPELSQTSKPQNQVCDVYNDGYNVMMIPNMRLNFKIDVEKICSYQRMMLHKHKKKIEDDVKIYGKDKV